MGDLASVIQEFERLGGPFIDGQCLAATRAGTVTHIDPNSGQPVATAPFGGYKQSGFGRFGGSAGLDECLQTKSVFIAAEASPA